MSALAVQSELRVRLLKPRFHKVRSGEFRLYPAGLAQWLRKSTRAQCPCGVLHPIYSPRDLLELQGSRGGAQFLQTVWKLLIPWLQGGARLRGAPEEIVWGLIEPP